MVVFRLAFALSDCSQIVFVCIGWLYSDCPLCWLIVITLPLCVRMFYYIQILLTSSLPVLNLSYILEVLQEHKSTKWNFNFKIPMNYIENYVLQRTKRERERERWVKAVRSLI